MQRTARFTPPFTRGLFVILIAGLVAVAGCMGPQESENNETDNQTDDNQTGDGNETDGGDGGDGATLIHESFTIEENATGVAVNLTIQAIDQESTNATARVIAANGTVVAEQEVELEPGNQTGTSVNLTVSIDESPGANETWEFEVWAPARILVSSAITFEGVEAEAEA